jgi:hypothetical protein
MGGSISGFGRRDILRATSGALISALLPSRAFAVPVIISPTLAEPSYVNAKNYGALGDGSTDDTDSLQRMLNSLKAIYIPAGTYCITQLNIPRGAVVRTDGLSTIFQQLPGQRTATPLIRITGSNVVIGSFACKGNIQSDTGEWMHAIQIIADDTTGSLANISLGEVAGQNIRGDVLLLAAAPQFTLSGVSAKSVSGDNIFRNIVSICGTGAAGGKINIERIEGEHVGLYHLDVEPDVGTPVADVSVGTVRGRNVGIVAPAANVSVQTVAIDTLELSPEYSSGSTPDYPNVELIRPHGLQLRNAASVKIGSLTARGFDGQAIKYVDSELRSMELEVESCTIEDCCRADLVHPAYILGAGVQAAIHIGRLDVAIQRDGISALMLASGCSVLSVKASLAPNTRLLNSCAAAKVSNVDVTGAYANLAVNTANATFTGGSGSFTTIAYNCDQLSFDGMTLQGSFAGGSPEQSHLLQDTTLNGQYYASAVYEPFAKSAAASQISPATSEQSTWFSALREPLFGRDAGVRKKVAVPVAVGGAFILSGKRAALWLVRVYQSGLA